MDGALLFPEAIYREQEVPEYRDNRFIEALPPILERGEAVDRMLRLVRVSDAERAASAKIRQHMIEGVADSFHQPLDAHVSLFDGVSVLIRRGYVKRNPARPEFLRLLLEGGRQLEMPAGSAASHQTLGPGSGPALIGMSGVGKSTAIEAVLACYPQVIWHPRLHACLRSVFQIVWLKLSCPHDGTIKGLCLQFFEEVDRLLGTNYRELHGQNRATVDSLRAGMARVAFIHGLGLLVVDEIQNLSEAKSGGDRLMMNFFKLLRDVMRVPVLTVGTMAAVDILGGGLQVARRHAGIPPFDRMKLNEQFHFFAESLFEAQYLRLPIKVTPGTLALLHDLSQGVTDLVVKLFVRAQDRALMCGIETLSDDLFREVYQDSFVLLHPFLEALRHDGKFDERQWDRTMLEARNAARGPSAAGRPQHRQIWSRLSSSPSASPTSPAAAVASGSAGKVTGVRKRTIRVPKGEESRCELVRTVEKAIRGDISPHAALVATGFIRNLGAEALRA